MKSIPRIRTRRTLSDRLLDYAESSWVPSIVIYGAVIALIAALNWIPT